MALALAIPAFAAEVTVGAEMNYARTTFSDVVSQEAVKGQLFSMEGNSNEIPFVTVKVGTTMTVENNGMAPNYSGRIFREAWVKEDGSYAHSPATGKEFNTGVADGTPYTLTEENIGLWYFSAGDFGKDFYLMVVAADGADTPAQPEQPAQPSEPEKPAEPGTSTEPEKPAVVIPEGAVTYTAQKWDTWGQLALNNYGTYGVWKQLMNANKGVSLKAGAVITLPAALGKTVRLAPQTLAEGEQFYTVKAGDTLGSIAANYYGNIKRYTDIFNRNSDRLTDANLIYEGQVLVLPAK